MSEHTSHDTVQRDSHETSPLVAGCLTVAFLLVLLGGGFGVWSFFVKQQAAHVAALKDRQDAEASRHAQLAPYKVDPQTGRLSKVNEQSGQAQNEDYLPKVGEFELIERSGRKVTNEDLLGQPYAVSFVFTKCFGPCMGITAQIAKLQKELKGAPVRLVTITVDPKHDTPEVLRNYADNFGADPDRWLFLTGEPEEVYKVLRENYRQFVREETGENRQRGYEVAHEAGVLHINAKGRIVKRYLGSDDAEMTRLRMALLKEAKQLAENPPESQPAEDASASSPPAVAEKPETGSEGGK